MSRSSEKPHLYAHFKNASILLDYDTCRGVPHLSKTYSIRATTWTNISNKWSKTEWLAMYTTASVKELIHTLVDVWTNGLLNSNRRLCQHKTCNCNYRMYQQTQSQDETHHSNSIQAIWAKVALIQPVKTQRYRQKFSLKPKTRDMQSKCRKSIGKLIWKEVTNIINSQLVLSRI